MSTVLYFFFFAPAAPAGPALSVTPTSLSFTTPEGINPPSQDLFITNTGTGTVNWTRSVAGGAVTATPGSGTAPSTLTVSLNVSGLLPGIYAGSVEVTAAGASGSPAIIPISLTVTAGTATLGVNPLVLMFTAQIATNPAPQTVTVVDLGAAPFAFTWTATPVGTGVSVTPTTGQPPGSFQVSIDTTGMAVGVHTRSIVVSTVP